ncbi:hypothetical protein [Paenibacillus beijingensis]|uniref:Uncharacterized protein n=1 Tax=Paenibacillus beijingensis TaxID=1126833 RepID=A0A0D5NIB2_9BACL|nr:hypothetical protein [Paenibacillus beijingensis]AJY74860.1 hypothetical protein VN24_09985 [Paenibacillus beijingensis]
MKKKASTHSAPPAWEQVSLIAKFADLQEQQYRTLLTLSAMLELLVDKGLLTRAEIESKADALKAADSGMLALISALSHPMASDGHDGSLAMDTRLV